MRSFVDFQVLTASEHFAAAGEGAGEGLLAGVDPDVVHQLVLGLEGLTFPGALLPQARVVGLLRPANMLHRDVRDDVVDAGKHLLAEFLRAVLPGAAAAPEPVVQRVAVHPQAAVLLLQARWAAAVQVAVEGAGAVRRHVVHRAQRHVVRRAEVHVREVHGSVQVGRGGVHVGALVSRAGGCEGGHGAGVGGHRMMLIAGPDMSAAGAGVGGEAGGEEGVGVAATGGHMGAGSAAWHRHGVLMTGRRRKEVVIGTVGARHRPEGMIGRTAWKKVRVGRRRGLGGLVALRGNGDGGGGGKGRRVEVGLSRRRGQLEARSAGGGGFHGGCVVRVGVEHAVPKAKLAVNSVGGEWRVEAVGATRPASAPLLIG